MKYVLALALFLAVTFPAFGQDVSSRLAALEQKVDSRLAAMEQKVDAGFAAQAQQIANLRQALIQPVPMPMASYSSSMMSVNYGMGMGAGTGPVRAFIAKKPIRTLLSKLKLGGGCK